MNRAVRAAPGVHHLRGGRDPGCTDAVHDFPGVSGQHPNTDHALESPTKGGARLGSFSHHRALISTRRTPVTCASESSGHLGLLVGAEGGPSVSAAALRSETADRWRKVRPGRAPVWVPLWRTSCPFTRTYSMPSL